MWSLILDLLHLVEDCSKAVTEALHVQDLNCRIYALESNQQHFYFSAIRSSTTFIATLVPNIWRKQLETFVQNLDKWNIVKYHILIIVVASFGIDTRFLHKYLGNLLYIIWLVPQKSPLRLQRRKQKEWTTSTNSFWFRIHVVILSVIREEKSPPQIIRTHCVFPVNYFGMYLYTRDKSNERVEQSVIPPNPKWMNPRPNPVDWCDNVLTPWISLRNVHWKARKWMNSASAETLPNWSNYPNFSFSPLVFKDFRCISSIELHESR